MKKFVVFLVAVLAFAGCSKSQNQIIKDNFYELYSKYNVIENGVYMVEKDGNYAIVDSNTGEIYAEFLYDRMEKITNEKILVAKKGNFSIISPKGKVLKELGQYGNVRVYFNNEQPRLLTYNEGYYTLLDDEGEKIGDYGTFDHLELNTKTFDRFVIQRGNLYTVINEQGNQVANLGRYDDLVHEFENDSYIVTRNDKKGIINHKGAVIVQLKYNDIWKMQKNDSYVLNLEDKFGAANKNGKQIIPVEYDGIEGYKNVLIAARDGNYGIYNLKGEELLACEYQKPYDVEETGKKFRCLVAKGEKVYSVEVKGEEFTITEK